MDPTRVPAKGTTLAKLHLGTGISGPSVSRGRVFVGTGDAFSIVSTSSSTGSIFALEVDTAGPKAKLTEHPKRKTRRHRARFKFKAKGAAGFQCKLDQKKFTKCRSPKRYRHLQQGKHSFKVRAKDQLGNLGEPATFKWKVRG